MIDAADSPTTSKPPFDRCPRCDYSLRGLPANHACPECGLRYDEACVVFAVVNPKQLVVVWIAIISGGWVSLKNLPHLANFAAATTWQKIGAIAGLLWIPMVVGLAWLLYTRYRRGFKVVVTGDGVMLNVPGLTDELIPWDRVESASIKDVREGQGQVVKVTLSSPERTIQIGGVANVFPERADAERFVEQVNRRTNATHGSDSAEG